MKLKSNYFISILIVIIMIIISFFVWENMIKVDQTEYIDGVYLNESYGYYSDILVKVTIRGQRIKDIEIISHEEPEILATIVFDRLPPQMIKYNSAQVDIIAGATYTSRSLINAVEKALEDALEEDSLEQVD